MSTSHNTGPGEEKPQPTGSPQKSNEQIPEKIVIPDECGDTMWEEVLAQQPNLSEIINTPKTTGSDKDTASLQS